MPSPLGVKLQDGALYIKGNHPTIDYSALEMLRETVKAASDDPSVRAISIDVSWDGVAEDMGNWPDRIAHRHPKGSHGPGPLVEQDTVRSIRECMKPTIALLSDQVNGLAIDLSAVCDIRYASKNLQMTDDRVRRGRTAATGITYILPKLIGQSQAMRILLLGDTLDAEEASRIHFVHETFDTHTFRKEIEERIGKIAKMPTRAWEIHKMQVLPQLDLPFEAAMTHSLGIRQTHVIEDRVEGMRAWREKREPEFTGR